MSIFSPKTCLLERKNIRLIWVVSIWLIGALSGVLLIAVSDMNSVLYSARFDQQSLPVYLILLFIPTILSLLLFRFCNFYFLLPVVFLKALLFASCGFAVRLAYGDAGWLVSGLMLLPDYLACCFLLCLWCCCACGGERIDRLALLGLCGIVFVGSIQYYVVLPFIGSLLNY